MLSYQAWRHSEVDPIEKSRSQNEILVCTESIKQLSDDDSFSCQIHLFCSNIECYTEIVDRYINLFGCERFTICRTSFYITTDMLVMLVNMFLACARIDANIHLHMFKAYEEKDCHTKSVSTPLLNSSNLLMNRYNLAFNLTLITCKFKRSISPEFMHSAGNWRQKTEKKVEAFMVHFVSTFIKTAFECVQTKSVHGCHQISMKCIHFAVLCIRWYPATLVSSYIHCVMLTMALANHPWAYINKVIGQGPVSSQRIFLCTSISNSILLKNCCTCCTNPLFRILWSSQQL